MLSRADAALVQWDAAIPGLALLLDPDGFAETLAAHPLAPEFDSVELMYVRYKPGTNCLADFRLRCGDRETRMYAKAFRSDAREKFDKAAGVALNRPGSAGLALRFAAHDVIAHEFPLDPKLPALTRLESPDRARLLGRILRTPGAEIEGDVIPLAYKPQRRFVGRLDREQRPPVVLRLYACEERFRAARSSEALEAGEILHLPRRVGRSKRHRAHAFEWLPGATLREVLDAPEPSIGSLQHVGHALAELHGQDAKLPLEPKGRVQQLGQLIETLDILLPSAAPLNRAIRLRLERCDRSNIGAPRPIHGDLHEKQVLLAGDRVGLCDLDDACLGDPADDLGLLIAHIERSRLTGRRSELLARQTVETLLESYRSARPMASTRLQRAVAEGLLHLAHHPFRNREPDWPDATRRLLERVHDLLGGVG